MTWGACGGDTIEELKQELFCDGIRCHYLDIEVSKGDKL